MSKAESQYPQQVFDYIDDLETLLRIDDGLRLLLNDMRFAYEKGMISTRTMLSFQADTIHDSILIGKRIEEIGGMNPLPWNSLAQAAKILLDLWDQVNWEQPELDVPDSEVTDDELAEFEALLRSMGAEVLLERDEEE